MDGATNARSLSIRERIEVFAARSRSNLWPGVPQSSRGNEYQRSPQRSAVSLATSLVERVIGSIRRECLDHVIVLGEESYVTFILSLLSPLAASPLVEERFAGITTRTIHRQDRCFSRSRWSTPALRSRRITSPSDLGFQTQSLVSLELHRDVAALTAFQTAPAVDAIPFRCHESVNPALMTFSGRTGRI